MKLLLIVYILSSFISSSLTNPLHWGPHKAQLNIYRHKSHDLSGQVRSFDKVNLVESELPAPWTLQSLNKHIKEKYTEPVNTILNYFVSGAGRNASYAALATFTDRFGPRLSGTPALENAIEDFSGNTDYAISEINSAGVQAKSEPAKVPHWQRVHEQLHLLQPRLARLALLAIGGSVSTPPGGIVAEALVVRSFAELRAKAAQARGKIVVYNEPYEGYGPSVAYRGSGAVEAARVGALAALVRSVASRSIYSPHTGMMSYASDVPRVAAACITVEDAEMLERMQARGERILLALNITTLDFGLADSRNVVADLPGTQSPKEMVLISGHMDSWDVGVGAMDDGGGMMISWQALVGLHRLGLSAARTIRAVLWTGEEFGGYGAQAYFDAHNKDADLYSLMLESDIGTFTPTGIGFYGSSAATKVMQSIMALMAPINATELAAGRADGTDIEPWFALHVPAGSLINENEHYFDYHHSNGDSMLVQDPREMDLCTALWAAVAYVVADLPFLLPR